MNTETKLTNFVNTFNGRIDIPPLKMNIHILIQAFADENLEIQELASILYHYPVISARLLGLANSAWARPVSPITNIEAACLRLGLSTVKGVSLALAVASSFDTTRCQAFDPIRFWTTSMLAAEGAAQLAAKLPDRSRYPEDIKLTVQTAGLLHNLGLLWLASNLAKETDQALRLAVANPLYNVNKALEEYAGIDYCMAGAWLFEHWDLPDELIAVVANHHGNPYPENASVQVLLVGTAVKMVSNLFHECNEITEDISLHLLGIEFEHQNKVFMQLADKLKSTRELAQALFV